MQQTGNPSIAHLVFDSRSISFADKSLFFSLHTGQQDGHRFISDAYRKGVVNFIVDKEVSVPDLPEANVLLVGNTLEALQQLAAFHRSHFQIPVIGITGSNGKTVVKEWLYQLLQPDYHIVRSPKSYNSQIGVPLSVWQMNGTHTLALFEAGISQPGEMERLEAIIKPTMGLLTNLGEAHSEGFASMQQKKEEKLKLFQNAGVVIGPDELLSACTAQKMTWSANGSAAVQVVAIQPYEHRTEVSVRYKNALHTVFLPFADEASIENGINCLCLMLYLGYAGEVINQRFSLLHAVDMRLQLKQGINGCTLINDSYSADLTSLHIALHFLVHQQTPQKRTVILSDFVESGKADERLYRDIANALIQNQVGKVIGIGKKIVKYLPSALPAGVEWQGYESTAAFVEGFRTSRFYNEIILVKGARQFGFERIVQLLEAKLHQTVLEINLNAVVHNLKQYRLLLKPSTKLMAMVKAFSYGSGGAEIASVLQYHNVHYLGVAYADEGIELVKAGIGLPIMVMNAEESSFQSIVDYNLQPVLYSFPLLRRFENYVREQGLSSYPVHIEIETGMNRLGFSLSEVEGLATYLASGSLFRVQSVFSHLAASDNPDQDDFTLQQAEIFSQAVGTIKKHISYPFLKHISNTAAIVRHPQLQMDMVRLGIGLYGIEPDRPPQVDLLAAATLRSTIAQLKHLKKGESVSYNRRGMVNRDSVIATIRIGYADGYSRQFSNGVGRMWVRGELAPVIGSVCMDMTMLDVTDIAGIQEGDEVVVFGPQLPVQQVAGWINTIPYELMTGVSQRVKRIYFQE